MDQTQTKRWLRIEARLLAAHPGLSDYENVLITSGRLQEPSGLRDEETLSVEELVFLHRLRREQEQEQELDRQPLPAQRHSPEETPVQAGARRP